MIGISPQFRRNFSSFFLSSDGTPTGNLNFNADYSVIAIEPFFQPPPGVKFVLTHFQFVLAASGRLQQGGYGNIVGPLPVGVDIRAIFNGNDIDISPTNVFDNNDLLFFSGGNTQILSYAQNKDSISSNLNITEVAQGVGLIFDGDTNDRIFVRLNDDFTTLDRQGFLLRGYVD